MQDTIYAGIDISKAWCDAAIDANSATARFEQTPHGRGDLIAWLMHHGVTHVVLEASGGYERPVLRAIDAAGVHACLVPPHRVRALARAAGRLAKTDALDARVLATFGRLIEPRVRQSQSEHMQVLAALVRRRRQIVDLITLEDNRHKQEDDPTILADIVALRLVLKDQLDALDRRIASQIAAAPELRDRHRVLMAFKGVGPVTCAVLLAEMPELGSLDAKQVATLAGLAPFNNDSGASAGKRSIHGGRTGVRMRPLYGRTERNPVQCRHQSLLQTPTRAGQTKKARPYRSRPEDHRHPERHAQRRKPTKDRLT